MIGAFYQPKAVIADIATLATLPEREFSAGLAEVIKYGLIVDSRFFEWLEDSIVDLKALQDAALTSAIKHCCEIKATIVAEDERETGKRALLNLGHTFGHALEAVGGYGHWLHGEAVAIGTSMAARVSHHLGMISLEDCERIDTLLRRAGLPVRAPDVDPDDLLAAMQLDKKQGSSGLRVILLRSIGTAVIQAAPPADTLRAVITEHGVS
jgi:3-dehydroquinate synthase